VRLLDEGLNYNSRKWDVLHTYPLSIIQVDRRILTLITGVVLGVVGHADNRLLDVSNKLLVITTTVLAELGRAVAHKKEFLIQKHNYLI
jgi:hypothetical protein